MGGAGFSTNTLDEEREKEVTGGNVGKEIFAKENVEPALGLEELREGKEVAAPFSPKLGEDPKLKEKEEDCE